MILAEKLDPRLDAHVRRRFDTGALVQDWADVVGSQNVTVVCVDKAAPTLIFDAFRALLGLPELARDESAPLNRSMTLVETELARRVVTELDGFEIPRQDRNRYLLRAGFRRVQEQRIPPTSETHIGLPAWAAKGAVELGAAQAKMIAASGVRVVGDLGTLSASVPSIPGDNPDVSNVPMDLAVDAIVGTVLRALGKDPLTGGELSSDSEAAR